MPDTSFKDSERVQLKENIEDYLKREVLPHLPNIFVDESKSKIGYEIPFTRHFYEYKPPRQLSEIDADLKRITLEIQSLLDEVSE